MIAKRLGATLKQLNMAGLWGCRSFESSNLACGRCDRQLIEALPVLFFTVEEDVMFLLHGFVKKSAKIPTTDLQVARDRRSKLRGCHD
jgi:hypothetical protein